MRTLVVVPMQKEIRAIFGDGSAWKQYEDVVVIESGIGKVNAALSTVMAIEQHRPEVVLNVGCAGALSPCLEIGDVVASSSCRYWDVDCGKPNPIGMVQGMPRDFLTQTWLFGLVMNAVQPVHFGECLCGDRLCDSETAKAIHEENPDAVAVDMESAAIAHTCYIRSLPFVSVRVISDTLEGARLKEYREFRDKPDAEKFAYVRKLVDALAKTKRTVVMI